VSRASQRTRLATDRAGVSRAEDVRRADLIIGEIEAERRELADRINDDPVQTLAHVSRMLQNLAELPETPAQAVRAARESGVLTAKVCEQLRGMARELRPPLLDDVGLGAALNQLADDFRAATGISAFTELGGAGKVQVPGTDLVLFRVAQAALHRAEERSGPTRVEISLRQDDAQVTLAVRDDGSGLPDGPPAEAGSTGFEEMAYRVQAVGGRLVVQSRPGEGTVVTASVPHRSAPPPSGSAPHEHLPGLRECS